MTEWNPEANKIFAEVAMLSDAVERRRLLDEKCGTDGDLRGAVESLLSAHEANPSFLDEALVKPELAATSISIEVQIGTQIGPYRLLQKIGEGGFGIVYMAEQKKPMRRKVALKIIKPGMDTREVIARFDAERQALAMMDHPNIAKVLDAGATDSGRPFFVMELVRGVAITEFCDKNHTDTRERLEMFATVCQAVQHAHQKSIIHRDLKPSNVMVTLNDGRPLVKVIDFGVAKAINQELTEKTLFTSYGQMVGTPQYMSPEQAEMSAMDIDTRSDIYSLGILLYELLTGTTPLGSNELRAAGFAELQRLIVAEEAPRPSVRLSTLGKELSILATNRKTDPTSLQKLVRGELDWIVMTALEKDRNRRYETASAFAADIGRYLANETVDACPPSVRYRAKKFVRRNRTALVTGLALTITLIGGIIGTSWMAVEAQKQAQLATLRAVEADEQKENATQALDRVQEHLRWKATMLAMSGMSEELEDVIRDVEVTSAPNKGWAQRVRAIAARFDEDPRAIELLNDAIELGDKTVAAYALMVDAIWASGGDFRRTTKYKELASSIAPETAEDELFLARIIYREDPKRAFLLADTVHKKYPSPAVLDTRSRACEHYGLITRDPKWIEQSIRDKYAAAYSTGRLPKNAIFHHAWAIELAGARGDQATVDYHTLLGEQLISEFGNVGYGMAYFHTALGDFERAEEAYRQGAINDHGKMVFSWFLFGRAKDVELMKVINEMDEPSRLSHLVALAKATALAKSRDTRPDSRDILLRELRKEEPNVPIVSAIGWLHGLGFRNDGISEAKRVVGRLQTTQREVPPKLEFLACLIDEPQLLERIGNDDLRAKANVYDLIVKRCLGEGNIAKATQLLAGWDGLHLNSSAYNQLMRIRNLMERDPQWPHWLPAADRDVSDG